MRLIFKKLRNSALNLMRQAGYGFVKHNPNSDEETYARRMGSGDYPKFHAFVKERDGSVFINLHLDQKKPTYVGSHAHSGEYEDSEALEKEARRLKEIFSSS